MSSNQGLKKINLMCAYRL